MAKNTPEKRELRRQRAEQALKERKAAERRRKIMTVAMVVAAVVVIAGVVFAIDKASGPSDNQKETPGVAADVEGTPGELDGFSVFVGEPDAPRTVTIYEDLQCPACANLETSLGAQLSDAVDAGDIRLDYRMIAFLDNASSNEYSSRALNALLATLHTAGVDAFRELHDNLFADQPAEGGAGFEDDELIERAVDAGAVEDEVRKPIEDKVYAQWIENATDQMSKDGVTGTPTIRIDGQDADAEGLASLLGTQ